MVQASPPQAKGGSSLVSRPCLTQARLELSISEVNAPKLIRDFFGMDRNSSCELHRVLGNTRLGEGPRLQ